MGERGGPAMALKKLLEPKPVNIRAMQQFLRAKGYNIAVDGINGPQTQSAAEDWRTARNPKIWSSRIKIDDPNRTNKPANAAGHRNQPADSPNNPLRPENKEPQGTRTTANVKGLGKGMLSNNAVNPAVYARAMVDSKYGPILGELIREEQAIREQGKNAVNQVGTWYSNIGQNMRERAEANKVNDTRVQSAIDSIAPGFASALGLEGGDAAVGDLMADSDVGSDFWRESAASQQAFDRSLQSVTQLKGAELQQGIQSETSNALRDLFGQRTDALNARGNEYISAEQDARVLNSNLESQRNRDRLAQVQAMLAAETAPMESAIKQQQLASLILGNQQTQQNAAYTAQERAAQAKAAKLKGTWQDPELDKDELLTNALSTIKLPSGQWRLGLNPSWARVKGYLGQRGLATNSTAGQAWLRNFAKIAGIRLGPKGNPIGRTKYTKR